MSWWNPASWGRKSKDPRVNHFFSDDDRSRAAEINREKATLRRKEQLLEHEIKMRELELRQAEIEDQLAQFDLDEEEEGQPMDAEAMLMQILAPAIAARFTQQAPPAQPTNQPQPAPPADTKRIPDEQLREFYSQIPGNIKAAARVASDERIEEEVLKVFPDADDDTLDRAIKIVKGG